MNRKQRRSLMHKVGKKINEKLDTITETIKQLDYIDLIQKLRLLNERQWEEMKQNADVDEDN